MGTEPFVCSATQNSNGSYILGVVVRYSLRAGIMLSANGPLNHFSVGGGQGPWALKDSFTARETATRACTTKRQLLSVSF
jgi:hypothetical protein